jgi:ferrous iron transport protein A
MDNLMKISLVELKENEVGRVVEILGGFGLCQKLDALGIRIGVELKKISSVVARGPVIVEVGNTKVALGYGMARRIIVEKQK